MPKADAVKAEVLESPEDLVIVDDEVPVEAAFEFHAKGANIAYGVERRYFKNRELDNYRPEQVRPPLERSEILSRAFACPFEKYRETLTTRAPSQRESQQGCSSELFSSVALLKDHILKAHFRSRYYCRSCYEGFETTVLLKAHGRCERPCSPRPCGLRETIGTEQSIKIAAINENKALKDYWYAIYRTLFPNSPEPSSPYMPFYQYISLESICQSMFRDFDADRPQTPSLSSGSSRSSSPAPSNLSCRNAMSIGPNVSSCAERGSQSRGHRPTNAARTTFTFCLRDDSEALLAHIGAQFYKVEFGEITQQKNGLNAEDWQSSISADGPHPNLTGSALAIRQFVATTAGAPGGAPNNRDQAEAYAGGKKRVRDEHIPSNQQWCDDERDDESEPEDEQPPSGTQIPDSAGAKAKPRVKCPLFALYPAAHPNCKDLGFRNTNDLTRVSRPTANPHGGFI
jgi:hypothetical protein